MDMKLVIAVSSRFGDWDGQINASGGQQMQPPCTARLEAGAIAPQSLIRPGCTDGPHLQPNQGHTRDKQDALLLYAREQVMISKLWTLRIAATVGCLVLFASCIIGGKLLMERSWQDFDDANVRSHIFRNHGFYNWDFIWSAITFGTIALTVVAMFMFCLWMCVLLIRRWDTLHGENPNRIKD